MVRTAAGELLHIFAARFLWIVTIVQPFECKLVDLGKFWAAQVAFVLEKRRPLGMRGVRNQILNMFACILCIRLKKDSECVGLSRTLDLNVVEQKAFDHIKVVAVIELQQTLDHSCLQGAF